MSASDEEYRLAPEDPPRNAAPESTQLRAGSDAGFVRQRLKSLDTYRGLIMISLAFNGFGLAATARNHLELKPDDQVWEQVHFQFTHVDWVGCGYWDLIQPSFMFMVGVSLAYSYAKRQQMGHSYFRMLSHAVWRSIVLIFLGIFLISNWGTSTNWSLMNVLTQIGLGYTFLFLLWNRSFLTQAIFGAVILFGVWLAYFMFPYVYPDKELDLASGGPQVGVTTEWAEEHLNGVGVGWHKNANLGHEVDVWLLNQIPRPEPFEYNSGGYQTINFIPSLVTMLIGLMCGELLRGNSSAGNKLLVLMLAGAAGMGVGWAMDATGLCPLVKRIWTPSWTLYSSGICCLILAGLYALIDVLRLGILAFPIIVVGVNSIAIYAMSMLLKPWTARTLETHFGDEVFRLRARWGDDLYRLWFVDDAMEAAFVPFEPTIQACLVGLCFWLICFWMYRQRIFVRI